MLSAQTCLSQVAAEFVYFIGFSIFHHALQRVSFCFQVANFQFKVVLEGKLQVPELVFAGALSVHNHLLNFVGHISGEFEAVLRKVNGLKEVLVEKVRV